MSKNTQALIWSLVALSSLVTGGWAYKRGQPNRPVSYKKTVLEKVVTGITIPVAHFFQAPAASTTQATTTLATSTSTQVANPIYIRKPKPKPAAPSRLSYGDAVIKYQSFRFQFGPTCQAIPNQMATANPVTIMLDNRSAASQTITILGQKYVVNAYDYAIVNIDQKILPQNVYISCNTQTNTAEILLQK